MKNIILNIYKKLFNKKSPEEILLLKEQLKIYKDKVWKLYIEEEKETRESYYKLNHTCIKCESTNIVNKIDTQIQSSLFFPYFDTNEYNVCNNCGHQWKKMNNYHITTSYIAEKHLFYIRYALQYYKEYKNVKFNPLDIEEEYSTIEDKKKSIQDKLDLWKKSMFRIFPVDEYSIEFIEHIAKGKLILDWKKTDFFKYWNKKIMHNEFGYRYLKEML